MNRIKLIGLLLLASLAVSSCGVTRVVSSNPRADLYVNGQYKGTGTARIHKMGPPQKVRIDARMNGSVVGLVTEHRRFTIITFIVGVYSYGTGFFLAWNYPDSILVPVDEAKASTSWETPAGQNAWDLPPGEYHRPSNRATW